MYTVADLPPAVYMCLFFFLMIRPPPRSPLFPSTTLFGSWRRHASRSRSDREDRPATPRSPAERDSAHGLRSSAAWPAYLLDRKSTRLNSSHSQISYAVFCLKKKKNTEDDWSRMRGE